MSIIKKTLKYFRKWFSGGSIRVTSHDPNNDADLESYQITTKNGNGSENIVRMHELEGITLKSNAAITLDAPEVIAPITVLQKTGVDNNGYSFSNKVDINYQNTGCVCITGRSDANNSEFRILLLNETLEITLGSQNFGYSTAIVLDPQSLKNLKDVLGL